MTINNITDVISRIRQAKQKFIGYVARGLVDSHYHRPNDIYHLWSFDKDRDNHIDWELFDIWAAVAKDFPSNWEYDEVLRQFDLMERYAKLWVFS